MNTDLVSIVGTTAVAERRSYPVANTWSAGIVRRFGTIEAVAARFSPKEQKYCADNLEKAIRADVPSLGRMLTTYPQQGIETIVKSHLCSAVLSLGSDREMDDRDISITARSICESSSLRPLNFSSVIGFFHYMAVGEVEIEQYRLTPRAVMKAFHRYAKTRIDAESRIKRQIEEEQARQASAGAISWDKYADRHGIAEKPHSQYAARIAREVRFEQTVHKTIASIIKTAVSVLTYVCFRMYPQAMNASQTLRNAPNSAFVSKSI